MTKVQVLKEYFGTIRPVTGTELIQLRRDDPAGYDELAELAAREMGVELDTNK